MIVSGKVCVSACSFLLVCDESLLLLRGLGFGGVVVCTPDDEHNDARNMLS